MKEALSPVREAAPLSLFTPFQVLRGMRGSAWKSWVAWIPHGKRYSSSFLQGTRPRFASGTLMSLRTIPPFLAGHSKGYRAGAAAFSGCALRVSARTLSAAKQGGAERPGDGCPCVGAEEICGAPPLNSRGDEDEHRPSNRATYINEERSVRIT